MKKTPKQEYTPEFRELSVKRVKAGRSVGTVARELGLIELYRLAFSGHGFATQAAFRMA